MRWFLIFLVLVFAVGCNRSTYKASDANLISDNLQTPPSPSPEEAKTVPFNKIADQLNLPRPEDFPVKERNSYSGIPKGVTLDSARSREFRSVIRERAARGPNFAGSYTVVTWGAGMGNFSFVIANARTGKLFYPPFQSVSRAGYDLQFDESEASVPAFRKDSTLFAFMGCPGNDYEGCANWEHDGFYVYSFENERLRLVRFIKREEFNAAGAN